MGPVAQFAEAKKSGLLGEDYERLSRGHRIVFLDLPNHHTIASFQASVGARAFRFAPQMFSRMFAHTLCASDAKILRQEHVEKSLIAMTLEAVRQGADGGLADLKIFSEPWPVAFEAITAPAIVWQGTADSIVPEAVSVWLSGLIPNCRLERLEDYGHFWVYDHIEEVLGAVAEMSTTAPANVDWAD